MSRMRSFASNRGQIIYNLYGQGNGDHIDRHHPNPARSANNITTSRNAAQLARDAIEIFGVKR